MGALDISNATTNKDDDGARSRRGTTADVDMKDSDNVSANGSTRSRRRDRSGDRSSRRPDSRDRRERYRSSGGDFYRGNGRNRTRSPSDDDRYYRPSDRSRRDDDRPRRRDRERGDRRSPRRDRGDSYRGGRAARDRSPPRQRTPEPTDDERDRRTVFVQQLAARLRTKELEAFFAQIGPVKEAQIVKDRVSGRSKGVGYVEFKEEESVQKALGLTGQKLLGIPVIVQLTEAEKNRQARVATGQPTQSNGIPFHRLYVGNIHFSVTEEDLRDVFSPFGELEFVQLQKEENGRSKGYGFVQYAALADMNGFEIAGRPIRVGLGSDKFTPESTASLLQRFGSQNQAAQFQGSSFSGAGGRGAHAGGNNNFDHLEEDFKEECSSKYGKVVHIGVFRDSSDGEIYVKFADIAGGDSALKGLNGRYFDGRTLTATPVVDAVYNMNFPKAASL
ncbi:unnamed protein product [Aureobasidium pullulans]|nr:unnamed protein product [Aureobasidium pullulans]